MILLQKNKLHQIFRYDSSNNSTILETFGSGNSSQLLAKIQKFRIRIDSTYDSSTGKLQFSGLEFINKNGNWFNYPLDVIEGTFDKSPPVKTGTGTNSEGPLKALRQNTQTISSKICLVNVNYPETITYDLKTPCLNLQIYNRWRWYTSNDSASESDRNLTKFALEVLINNQWIEVDYGDLSNKKDWSSMGPYSMAYEGNIKIRN